MNRIVNESTNYLPDGVSNVTLLVIVNSRTEDKEKILKAMYESLSNNGFDTLQLSDSFKEERFSGQSVKDSVKAFRGKVKFLEKSYPYKFNLISSAELAKFPIEEFRYVLLNSQECSIKSPDDAWVARTKNQFYDRLEQRYFEQFYYSYLRYLFKEPKKH